MIQTFPQWFKQQATRLDAVGELARKHSRFKSFEKMTDHFDSLLNLVGETSEDHQQAVEELKTAYQAREEWEKLIKD